MHTHIGRALIPMVVAVSLMLTIVPPRATGAVSASPAPSRTTLRVTPRCVSVRTHGRKILTIVLKHGAKGALYSFALVPLFGRGLHLGPNLGRHKANRYGMVGFRYPAPNHRREAGRWQISATRRLSFNSFKLAAVTHLEVKRGRCLKKS